MHVLNAIILHVDRMAIVSVCLWHKGADGILPVLSSHSHVLQIINKLTKRISKQI